MFKVIDSDGDINWVRPDHVAYIEGYGSAHVYFAGGSSISLSTDEGQRLLEVCS